MAKKDFAPLVIKAQTGHSDALSQLLSESYETLYYYAYKSVNDPELAADITQESCIEIMQTLKNLRDPNAYHTWAGRIVYHQCTRYFRQVQEVPLEENEDGETILDQLPDESRQAVPELVQEDKEFQKTILDMLDRLPAQQRTAMVLYYYENLSVGQIAQIQDTSEGTVKSRLNYGRQAVKKEVEAYEKRTGVRLHSIAPLPLLLYFLFGQEFSVVAEGTAPVLANVGAGVSGSVAASAGTATAGAAGTGIVVKVVAAIAAAVVAVAAVAGGIALSRRWQEDPAGQTVQPTQATLGEQIQQTQAEISTGSMEQWKAFFGTWYGGKENAPLVEFGENTATLLDRSFTWSLEDCRYSANENYAGTFLRSADGKVAFALDFRLMDDGKWGGYICQLGEFDGVDSYAGLDDAEDYFLYRPDDYAGYTTVMLTPENILDYVEVVHRFEPVWDGAGKITAVDVYTHERFKEGLGCASFAEAQMFALVEWLTAKPEGTDGELQYALHNVTLEKTDPIRYTGYDSSEWFLTSQLDDRGQIRANVTRCNYLDAVSAGGYVLVPEGYQPTQTPLCTTMEMLVGDWKPVDANVSAFADHLTVYANGTLSVAGLRLAFEGMSYFDPAYHDREQVNISLDTRPLGLLSVWMGDIAVYRNDEGKLIAEFYIGSITDPDNEMLCILVKE